MINSKKFPPIILFINIICFGLSASALSKKTIYGHEYPYFNQYTQQTGSEVLNYVMDCGDISTKRQEKIECFINSFLFSNRSNGCSILSFSDEQVFLYDTKSRVWFHNAPPKGSCNIVNTSFLKYEKPISRWVYLKDSAILTKALNEYKECNKINRKQINAIESNNNQRLKLNCDTLIL